jgi:hypothetical protein
MQYISPQQQAGEEPDARDDIYSAAIPACELLAGRRPGALGIAKLLQRAGLDGRLLPTLQKALEPERPEQYASAGEMADDIEASSTQVKSRAIEDLRAPAPLRGAVLRMTPSTCSRCFRHTPLPPAHPSIAVALRPGAVL